MVNIGNAAAAARDAEIITKRRADGLALVEADRQNKRQALDAELAAAQITAQ
jgi:hypothetical protein